MILGISLDSINSERKEFKGGDFKISYSSEITDLKETEIPTFNEKVAELKFSFDVVYQQKENIVGTIKFTGSILWKGNLKELTEKWKKEKKLPEDVGLNVLNNLYRRCLIVGVQISEQLGLPSPIPLPKVALKE